MTDVMIGEDEVGDEISSNPDDSSALLIRSRSQKKICRYQPSRKMDKTQYPAANFFIDELRLLKIVFVLDTTIRLESKFEGTVYVLQSLSISL